MNTTMLEMSLFFLYVPVSLLEKYFKRRFKRVLTVYFDSRCLVTQRSRTPLAALEI